MQNTKERSLGELFSELSRETSTLVRQEVHLAKVEMSEKASEIGKHVSTLVIGGAIAYAGLLAILAAAIIALAEILPDWAAALVVGLVAAGLGYFMLQQAMSALKNVDMKPRETIESLKEDKEWIQEQTS
ncbi:MAG: phage holin family protein [Ardenticatenales bacterium]|nr:phage holin family protein [Ardenticatenales bacterium]